ncbi:MAG: acyltransferase, partial [Candidatus Eremiobacterota bacterium]
MGIRFFAAISVVFYHLGWVRMTTAVTLFFMLSGFILTWKYTDDQGMKLEAPRFWLARASRLYPCYLLGLLLLLLWRLTIPYDFGATVGSLVASALMVQAWCPWLVFGWNTPGWTCSCEAFFYLLFPMLAVGVSRLRRVPTMLMAMALLYASGLAMSWAFAWRLEDARLIDIDPWFLFTKYAPIVRLPEFAMGMVLGRWYLVSQPSSRPILGAWLSGVAVVVSVALSETGGGVPGIVLHNTFTAPVYAVLVWGLALGGGLAVPLANPWLVRLGYASYAFYILQDPVGLPLFWWLGHPGWEDQTPAAGLTLTALLVVASVAVYRWFEEPVMNRARRAWGGSRSRPGAGESLKAGGLG